MTELEKLHAGLEYDMWAPEIDALKLRAMTLCRRLNALPKEAKEERTAVMRELFGSVGENAAVMPYFSCDDGKSIFIGKNFLANYDVSNTGPCAGAYRGLCYDWSAHPDRHRQPSHLPYGTAETPERGQTGDYRQ